MSTTLPDTTGQVQEAATLCARGLDGLGGEFLNPFHGREHEFLRLGHALDGFNSKAIEVSRMAEGLTDMTTGAAVLNATVKLSSHLSRLGAACSMAASGAELSGLDAVAEVGSALIEGLRDFTRLVKHLTMLGIATRIESARLGSQGLGFSTLADDVEKLAGKIAASSGKILSGAQGLIGQCQEAGVSLAQMSEARLSCSTAAMETLQADVGALERLVDSSRQAAVEISAEAARNVESVSEAVLSMQFHDIIRQQLEHVAEAADEARNMALEGPLTEGGLYAESWEELAGWMKSVLVLQHSQLGNARSRFAEAMQSLGESLSEIARRVESMSAKAGGLAGGDSGHGGVLNQIEEEVGRMVRSLREFAVLERRMTGVMREVGASIEAMSSLVAEIEEVGSEIELIALNASVKAAHTGEEGKALGVLASAIQKLSVDARGQTDRIMELLATVDSSALAQAGEDRSFDKAQVFEEAVADLGSEVANLKSLDSRVSEAAGRLQMAAADLSRDILEAVQSLEFHHGLLDGMTSAEVRLWELVEQLQSALPTNLSNTHSPKLMEMLARYTMDAERLVHETVLGIPGVPSSVKRDADGDFDDNVELF
jgi:methyl-accepting chemotaxis protein